MNRRGFILTAPAVVASTGVFGGALRSIFEPPRGIITLRSGKVLRAAAAKVDWSETDIIREIVRRDHLFATLPFKRVEGRLVVSPNPHS